MTKVPLSNAARRRTPIFGLDLIRFFAAWAVLTYHLGFKAFVLHESAASAQLGLPTSIPPWGPLTWWGWIGVQIFFVISGFVISYSIENAGWRSFIRRRIARLLPAMLISASTIALVAVAWEGATPARTAILWAKSVTFFPIGPWLSGQFWTIPVEVCFYGLMCLLICAGQERRLESIAWALGLLSLAYWVSVAYGGFRDPVVRLTALVLLQHGCYFAIGVLISVIDRRGFKARSVLIGTVCLAAAWLQIHSTARTEAFGTNYNAPAVVPFAIWVVTSALIAASVFLKEPMARRLNRYAGPIRMIGLSTYPLYLLHMHVGLPLLVEARRTGVADAVGLIAALAGSVAAAWFVAKYLEPPVHSALDRVLRVPLP